MENYLNLNEHLNLNLNQNKSYLIGNIQGKTKYSTDSALIMDEIKDII